MTDKAAARHSFTEPGFVLVDKPQGWTSHDVVGRTRRVLGTRKVGHSGTLDPLATGLLILGVNRSTRLLGYLTGADKEYISDIRLGIATHSDDADGEVVTTADASNVTRERVAVALTAFRGTISQVPSAVSAIKVDGRRAHERVRAGEEVSLPAREVSIYECELLDFTPGANPDIRIRVKCSSGTYIRSIARDLGVALGVGGHVRTLRRTQVGEFTVDEAQDIESLTESPIVHAPAEIVSRLFETIELTSDEAAEVNFGRPIPGRQFVTPDVGGVLSPSGEFLALYKNAGTRISPVAVFV